MTIIPVSGGAFAAYDVVVGRGLLAQAGAHIAPLARGGRSSSPTRRLRVSMPRP